MSKLVDSRWLSAWLQERLAEYLEDLRAMVNVDCGTNNKEGVDRVGKKFREFLQAAGASIFESPLAEYGDCCLATWKGSGKLRLLLSGHLDTVYPQGTVAGRPMKIDGNFILGPGTSDMKAGLLSCGSLMSLASLKVCCRPSADPPGNTTRSPRRPSRLLAPPR